jgi:hypothetical protein
VLQDPLGSEATEGANPEVERGSWEVPSHMPLSSSNRRRWLSRGFSQIIRRSTSCVEPLRVTCQTGSLAARERRAFLEQDRLSWASMSSVGYGDVHWGLVGAFRPGGHSDPGGAFKPGGHWDPGLGRGRPGGHWNPRSSGKKIGGGPFGLDGVCRTRGGKIKDGVRTSVGLLGAAEGRVLSGGDQELSGRNTC